MDLNGNGLMDIISGSYSPGELYLFARQADGTFAAGEVIRDKDGNPLRPGAASTVFAADFNGNGQLDLLMGNIQGEVFVSINEGVAKENAFGELQRVQAAGADIRTPGGDSAPILADWDGDGLPDLIVGDGAGNVTLYLNEGSRAEPKFGEGRPLVAAAADRAQDGSRMGTRTKPAVADFNGNGRLDLLVGDFGFIQQQLAELSPEDQARVEKLQQEYAEIMEKYMEAYEQSELPALMEQYQQLAAETGGDEQERQREMEELMARGNEISTAVLSEYMERIMEIQSQMPGRGGDYQGYVWLFLRQEPGVAAAP